MLLIGILLLGAAGAIAWKRKWISKRIAFYTTYAISSPKDRLRLTAHKETYLNGSEK